MKTHSFIRKLFIYNVLVLLLATQTNAQRPIKWLHIGVNGGVGSSYFINRNFGLEDKVLLDAFTLSGCFGGSLGITVGDNFDISCEAYTANFGQKFDITAKAVNYNKDVRIYTTEYAIVLKYIALTSVYGEIGLKKSLFNKITEENNLENVDISTDNIEKKYATEANSIIAGLGLSLYRGRRTSINIGLRANYTYTDIAAQNAQILDDGFSDIVFYEQASTNALTIHALCSMNYIFAFWGDATCGRGRIQFFK